MQKYSILLQTSAQFLILSSRNYKVFGPYSRKSDGRQIVIIRNTDGTYRTVSYPKYLMEQHLGRELDPDAETIDHIDCNFSNNDLSNLRLVPRAEHSADDTRRVKLVEFECCQCHKKFERSPRLVRDKSKKGRTGIFCSRSCAGKYSRDLQLGRTEKLPIQPYIQSEYYRKKNVKAKEDSDEFWREAFIDYLTVKYG